MRFWPPAGKQARTGLYEISVTVSCSGAVLGSRRDLRRRGRRATVWRRAIFLAVFERDVEWERIRRCATKILYVRRKNRELAFPSQRHESAPSGIDLDGRPCST